MAVGLREEYAKLVVGKLKINVLIRELRNRFVPPSDGFLFAEHSRNAEIESVRNEVAFALDGGLVGPPPGIGNDCEQDDAEQGRRQAYRHRQAVQVPAKMI